MNLPVESSRTDSSPSHFSSPPVIQIYCDGASRGNPGPAAIGGILLEGEEILAEISERIGSTTNNVAEYRSLIACLEKAVELKRKKMNIFMDSELVVKQVRGEYKVKKEHLKAYHAQVKVLLEGLVWTIGHVRREENARADALANRALDRSN
ncbi:MAG: ribonuclease HI family protein [Spirochaetales bacterium]|nr:ribonuclease HI family protein [Spirochaetales bacterium]